MHDPLHESDTDDFAPPSPGRSAGANLAIGCAVVALLAMVLVCGGIIVGGYWARGVVERELEAFAAPFEAEGFVRQIGQDIRVTSAPNEDMIYVGQNITIAVPVEVNLAILAQTAKISSDVSGDVTFLGQILTVDAGVTIHGDLEVRGAQLVRMRGVVTGAVTGSWQIFEEEAAPAGEVNPKAGDGPDRAGDEEGI